MMGIKDAIANLVGAPVISGRPEDIPQDVWDATTGYVKEYLGPNGEINNTPHELAARAVIAERERCAKVAETLFSRTPKEGRKTLYKSQEFAVYASDIIAAAIRGGSND